MDEDRAEEIITVIWDCWEEKLYNWDLESPRAYDEARDLAIKALMESKLK